MTAPVSQVLSEAADLRAENVKLRNLLGDLERSATSVHRRGAVTGPQWSRLAGDLIVVRAALAKEQGR